MASPDHVLTDVPRSRRRWPTFVCAVAGIASLVAGVVVLVAGYTPPAEFGPPPAPVVSPAPLVAVPARAEPAPVVGTVPVEVYLPARAVTAPVVPVGTGPAGGMVIPEPASTVGWWAPGPLVGGATGTALIAGHVDSRITGLGAFAVLREVGPGEPVEVRGADGRVLRYVVTARREYVKADLPAELFASGGSPGLVLITCGGTFDPATGSYEDNVVVHAIPAT